MQQLTDEERKKIVAEVREVALMWGGGSKPRNITEQAADELERLAEEVEAMIDCDNQKLQEAEMRSLALSEEIEYQHKEIERLAKRVAELEAMPRQC